MMPPPRAKGLRRRATGALAGCLLFAGVASGCTTARNDLGTSASSCFLALPSASAAVHRHGKLFGVEGFTLAGLRRLTPHLFADLGTTEALSQRVCVTAYTGHFTAASVSHPRGRSSGRLAVVVSTFPTNKLLGTVIFIHPPFHFGHSHIG
jgi:hypothetical protein